MADIWTIGPTAAACALRARGFSLRQAEALVALKLQYQRQVLDERVAAKRRLAFGRWLVEQGRLSDWPEKPIDSCPTRTVHSARASAGTPSPST